MSSEAKLKARTNWITRQQSYWNNMAFPRYITRIGEIYEIDFGENIGTEFSGVHLAVCLSNTSPDQERVLVIPLTTKYMEYNVNPKDIVCTRATNGAMIKAGAVIGEAKWISKKRIFKVSYILGESQEDAYRLNITKGVIKVPDWLLEKWSKL